MPPARSARRQQRCGCDYFFLLRFRLRVPPFFGVSGVTLFFNGCALRRSACGWPVGGGVTISGVRTPGLTSRRDAESERSGFRSRLAGIKAGRRSAGVTSGCIFVDGCACTCGDAVGVISGRFAGVTCGAVCAGGLCGAEGVTRAGTPDGACRPVDAACRRAGETALPETGRIVCGGASRAGEIRACSAWPDAMLPATAAAVAAVTAAVPEAATVPSLTCCVPPAVMDGETGVTRVTGCSVFDIAVWFSTPIRFCCTCRGDGGMTGLILPDCRARSACVVPRPGAEAASPPGSGAGLLPAKSCSACSGERGICCGETGETIWLTCPSAVRDGMTGGSLLPAVSGGLMRPKSAGSGRMGGAGGMTRLPVPETVWEVLFCTTLLPV